VDCSHILHAENGDLMLKPNLICLVGLVVMILLAGASSDTGTSVTPASAPTAESPLPRDEAEFISLLASFKERYHAAANEFQKSTVRRERSAALARSQRDRSVDGWNGTVSSIQTTGDGSGILSIKPLGYGWITIETWNNSLSDIDSGSLIPAGSPLYEQVSHLSVGEQVIFAGTFGSGELDYLKESSLTEVGAMDEPEFIFTFSSVRSGTGQNATPASVPQNSTGESAKSPEKQPTDGCDKQIRSKAMDYAFNRAFPPDPLADTPSLPQLSGGTLVLPDGQGEPSVVRDINLSNSSPAVCVYSDENVSVYVPTSLFTERMVALGAGRRAPHEKFLGLPMPQSRFDALTYWNFKHPRAPEFAWVQNRDGIRYEARQALFDVDQKVVLFTSDVLADSSGQVTEQLSDRQRIALNDGEHPVMSRVFESLGDLINAWDLKIEMIWKAQH
jgi:hypothetical protein